MSNTGYLQGKILLAMPAMGDPRFERSVIYLCSHNDDGAMGLVINRHVKRLEFSELLEQLDIEVDQPVPNLPLHAGGPVETGRGFVLHSADYGEPTTLKVSDTVGLTATVECLKLIADDNGPKQSLLALGYAGWAAGQLENEMQHNAWLSGDVDSRIIFETPIEEKWPQAMIMMGIDVSKLSADAGHA